MPNRYHLSKVTSRHNMHHANPYIVSTIVLTDYASVIAIPSIKIAITKQGLKLLD